MRRSELYAQYFHGPRRVRVSEYNQYNSFIRAGPSQFPDSLIYPNHCSPSLCPRQLVMKKIFLVRTLHSSLQSRLFRNRLQPLSHGRKSGFCLFSSLQNRLPPRSSIPSLQRSVAFCRLGLFLLIHPLQFVRNVGITHGDESRVGYYVGMMVCCIPKLKRLPRLT